MQKANWIGLVAGLALFFLFALHFINYAPDDVFISLRYAENFANGNGLVFNPGERVEGYSNFLWVMLLAPIAAITGKAGLTMAAKLIGLACGLFALALLGLIAKRRPVIAGAQDFWGIAPLGFGIFGYAAFWSSSGMETGFYLLLISWALGAGLAYLQKPGWLWGAVSAVSFFSVALTRPEGILFFAAFCAARFLFFIKDRKKPAAFDYLLVIGVVAAYGLFFLWRHGYYGQWWPNTFYAKAGGGMAKYAEGARYLLLNLPALFWSNPVLSALLIVPLADLRAVNSRGVFLWLALCAQVLFVFYAGGDWMEGARFLVPAMPVVALLAPGAVSVFRRSEAIEKRETLSRWFKGALVVVFFACALVHLYHAKQVRHDVSGLGAYEGARFFKDDHFVVAEFLKQHAKPGALVALGEAGLIPFLTDLPALDLFGLMDPYLARLPGLRHQKIDADYVFAKSPEFIILGGCKIWSDQVTSDFEYARVLLADPRLNKQYQRVLAHHTFLVYQRLSQPGAAVPQEDAI